MVIMMVGFVFVDNMDIINSEKSVNAKGKDLLQQQQRLVNTWKGTLRSARKSLILDRSY